jgi:hypothetical protein
VNEEERLRRWLARAMEMDEDPPTDLVTMFRAAHPVEQAKIIAGLKHLLEGNRGLAETVRDLLGAA